MTDTFIVPTGHATASAQAAPWPNPLLGGFHPDPSICAVDGTYYLVTSTFEYLPGLPVYRSTDLVSWEQLGNVATRPEQVDVGDVQTGGGVWAPTIRHYDGRFYLIVTIAMSPRGCVVFTADDPAGPWSDGVTLEGIPGIDPDIAWDADGTCYVTFSGLVTHGPDAGTHTGIQQVRVDLDAGRAIEEPRSLWSGSGLKFPEAPHLYEVDGTWFLVIAEGGTERGHSVSVARSDSPTGPFEPHPANPVMSARSTSRTIQNAGHGDLVELADGRWALICLGVRPLGMTQSFSPHGRETFATPVEWVDGWPIPGPVELNPRPGTEEYAASLRDADELADPGWLAVRALPTEVAVIADGTGLTIAGRGVGMDDSHPAFVGRRQRHLAQQVEVTIDPLDGVGGLAFRYDELSYVALEVAAGSGGVQVTARAQVSTLGQSWVAELPAGPVRLAMEMTPPPEGFDSRAMGADRIVLRATGTDGKTIELIELDGRFWTSESCTSFTGRVVGMYAVDGSPVFTDFRIAGHEPAARPAAEAEPTAG